MTRKMGDKTMLELAMRLGGWLREVTQPTVSKGYVYRGMGRGEQIEGRDA